jgi:hypothetical protein
VSPFLSCGTLLDSAITSVLQFARKSQPSYERLSAVAEYPSVAKTADAEEAP